MVCTGIETDDEVSQEGTSGNECAGESQTEVDTGEPNRQPEQETKMKADREPRSSENLRWLKSSLLACDPVLTACDELDRIVDRPEQPLDCASSAPALLVA